MSLNSRGARLERRWYGGWNDAPTYVESDELRRWCQDNRNKFHIPEWLLKTWGISVNSDVPRADRAGLAGEAY